MEDEKECETCKLSEEVGGFCSKHDFSFLVNEIKEEFPRGPSPN